MKISVCIATYNGEKYILELLNSILGQSISPHEIIISDSNSTDSTLEVINNIKSPLISIFQFDLKPGLTIMQRISQNFENALRHATGDVIFLADQDDFWLPEKISTMVKDLEGYDLVLSDCSVTDSNLNIINNSYFLLNKSSKGIFFNFYKNSFPGCCMCFHRRVLEVALPFPRISVAHDAWIGLLAEIFFKVRLCRNPLILYRRHYNTSSSAGFQKRRALFVVFQHRFLILLALFARFLKVLLRHIKDAIF